MSEVLRPSPKHKTVSFFVTCMADVVFPNIGISTIKILDHLGIKSQFPMGQTCCGQPAFNAGFWDDARAVARNYINTFADSDLVVTPSGSCASMVQHYYPTLFEDEPAMLEKARWVASITWELTEYLVDGLGVTDLETSLPPTRVAFHDACHGYRLIGLHEQARALVESIDGVEVAEMSGSDECCGFGGLFSVKMPEISGAMLRRKMENIIAADADVVLTGDAGCMAQINGGLSRNDHAQRVMHIADFLADALGR